MTYDIVFIDKENQQTQKAVGENIFISMLPTSPKVFALFYPGTTDTDEVEKQLRTLGRKTGDNLFINIGSLADPDYERACDQFGIGRLPVIVITAISPLASTPDGDTAFIRLDGKSLFAKPGDLVRTVEELFNLFLVGKISEAIRIAWGHQGKAAIIAAAERVWTVIRPIIAWAAEMEYTFEFASVKIEVKPTGED